MTTTEHRLTADEFLALAFEERHVQLVDGEVVVDEPNWRHQQLQGFVYVQLHLWTEVSPGRGRASLPVDVRMDERNVYAPDVLWLQDAPPKRFDARLPGLPDLAVEVRSPSTWRHNLGRKKSTYEERGIAELWLVDGMAETVLVFRRSIRSAPRFDIALEVAADEVLTTSLLPGFELDIEELFDR